MGRGRVITVAGRTGVMKNWLFATVLFLLTGTMALAQRDRHTGRIHAAKMAFIIDRLRLTSQQTNEFVPLYNDYEDEIKEVRHTIFRKYIGANLRDADDETSRQFIDDNLDYQQTVLDIKRKYNDRFLRVISPQQLSELNRAEREFKEMLIKRLDHRPHMPQSVRNRINYHRNGYQPR